jgi:hypothetical protein
VVRQPARSSSRRSACWRMAPCWRWRSNRWRGVGRARGTMGAILNHAPCGTSVPIGCELRPPPWGQALSACVRAVGSRGDGVERCAAYRSAIRS